jgi:hypothetical protein
MLACRSPLTTASLAHMPDETLKKQKATTVTFLAGSQDHMRVEQVFYYSVYLLYWYKSTNTDAEGAASGP